MSYALNIFVDATLSLRSPEENSERIQPQLFFAEAHGVHFNLSEPSSLLPRATQNLSVSLLESPEGVFLLPQPLLFSRLFVSSLVVLEVREFSPLTMYYATSAWMFLMSV